ncbi:leucine-rich repeat receptor-like serine/threonine/tyrosine-protein kinase SOBIR1 [Salvia miltiorrhiza]|uniref:leucine-rich repeat receptor-like serine/threonine/tyrosine-protein kinase SOBIR1 n=1 Tax=Salvia miltiorrhiza TaxID=226208 RepID=UPI0025AC546C|nr:leucine-rich repeat receptor-like serine/threonine/tyrosine-protein kinase SOBIR1 [Salvia miltiorrhiza]
MAPTPSKCHLFLLHFTTLILLVQSRSPTLLRSDLEALLLIHKDLGFRRSPVANPCDSAGIFCERRSVNTSHTLRITGLVFESQQLDGRLSPAISKLTELKQLSLQDNNLFDQIPAQIVECKKLEILDLRNNQFSGQIPVGLSWLIRLRVLDLSGNMFTGNLKFLKHFPNLEKLNLADNMFAGTVPASLRSFRNLQFVDVSGNSLLVGPLPSINNHENQEHSQAPGMLRRTTGSAADQSHHSVAAESTGIQSTVPKRYSLAEISPAAAKNGTKLPALFLAPGPSPAGGPSAAPTGRHRKSNKKRIIGWSLGFVAGVIGGILSGLVFSLVFKLLLLLINGRNKDTGIKIFSPLIKKPEDLAFLEKEDGLSSLNIIGKGGCGEVYKAVLPGSDGKEIAIKKINQSATDTEELTEEDSKLLNKKMRQIRSEIKTVGEIRHRNLLPLLAHLPRPDCHYLVYEYMKNGSVHDYLLQVSRGERELEWAARYKIIMGIAAGLEYLHMNHTPRIIHRDLKPANVLLDDEMEARIADFGLAKSVPDANTHVSTSNIAGTAGYIAPEYYQTFKFTDKCDVYSFGVVLAVVVMGKMPSDEFFQNTEEMSLVKWMRNVMTSDDPKRAIDPKLMGNGHEEQMLLALKVACFCTLDNPKERPNSKDARTMLSQITH